MYVLGIDPGLTRCGYGCVDARSGQQRAVAAGLITTPLDLSLPDRLALLRKELVTLMGELQPDAVVVERVLFQTNARTAMSVGQASGLALATAAESRIEVAEYSSNEVKLAVAGYGAATKMQVQEMVTKLLNLREIPRPPDVADALALAVCHLAMIRGHGLVEANTSPGRRRRFS